MSGPLTEGEVWALASDPDGAVAEPPGTTDFRQLGFGTYELVVPGKGVRIVLANVTRTRDGLRAEVSAFSSAPGARTVPSVPGLVLYEHLNLLSGSTRASLVKRLSERAGSVDVDWAALVDECVHATLQAHSAGAPVVALADLPPRLDPGPRIDPILPAETAIILFGAGGTGKSTLAAAVGVSVASGAVVVPGWVPRKAPVLLLDWEEEDYIAKERAAAIARGAYLPEFPRDLLYRRMAGRLADEAEVVARLVAEHGIGLLVVDSVGAAMGSVGEGDQADSANRLFDAVRHIGTSTLLVDHVAGENISKRDVRKPYGSVYKENRSRGTFHVACTSVDDDASRVLVVANAKPLASRAQLAPVGLRLSYGADSIVFSEEVVPDAPGGDRGPTFAERLANLLAHHGPSEAAFLAREAGTTPNNVRNVLSRHKDLFLPRPAPPGAPTVWALRDVPEEDLP